LSEEKRKFAQNYHFALLETFMVNISLDQIKKLRAKTKAGVMDCRQALEESQGDIVKAEKWLREKGLKTAAKKEGRQTKQGRIEVYSHGEGKIVGLVELLCETDFVARTQDFKDLAHELAMQVAAMEPKDKEELLKQPWIRDEAKTIEELVKELIAKTGENIKIGQIARFELGAK
jgi:elongation factor Ts